MMVATLRPTSGLGVRPSGHAKWRPMACRHSQAARASSSASARIILPEGRDPGQVQTQQVAPPD